jgi:uncharacterized protein (DUF1697 family)
MKYVALLRGINVGGNAIIKMADLKSAFERCGFSNVKTFIQSGNVIFESDDEDQNKITKQLEKCLEQNFRVSAPAIIKTRTQLQKIVAEAPARWKTSEDLRKYIAFVKEPKTARYIMGEVEPREAVDFAEQGDGAVYMSTLLKRTE